MSSNFWHSRGYLPHFDPGPVPQGITLRLRDFLPRKLLEQWRKEATRSSDMELRRKIEDYLDRGYGRAFLREAPLATIVEDALLRFDEERYQLGAWVIMPNHEHLLLTPREGYTLDGIMHSIKSYTAQEVNKALGRKGPFWMPDYFDRRIRNARHYAAARAYIERNPVKAGLCQAARHWRFSSARFRANRA